MRFTEKYFFDRDVAPLSLWLFVCAVALVSVSGFARAQAMQDPLLQLAGQGRLEISGATVYKLSVTQTFYERNEWEPAWSRQASVEELAAAIDQAWRAVNELPS